MASREPDRTGRLARTMVGVAAVLAAVAVARWLARPAPSPAPVPTAAGPPSTSSVGRPAEPTPTPRPGAAARPAPRPLPREARALARAAVDRYIAEAGLDEALDEADRRALVAALGRVRHYSLLRQRVPAERHALQRKYERVLVQADALFREKLGVGVAAFVAAQREPGTLEDLGAARERGR